MRALARTLGIVALASALACATQPVKSLTDGRGSAAGPEAPAPSKPSPSPAVDAGVTLPKEGAASPLPAATVVTPSSALVGGVAPTVSITGSNFVARTILELDGAAIPTSFVSDHELRATLPTALLAVSGTHALTVFTSAPGGGRSAPLSLAIDDPLATVTNLTPNAVLVSAGDTTVTVTGSGFVKGSTVTFGGAPVVTSYVSAAQVQAAIPAAKLGLSGSVPIVVVNPAPGGGPSTPLSFTVANPTVTVTTIAPISALVGSASTTITVTGTGFVTASAVSFNGAPVTTTFVSATQLTATLPAAALATTGNFPLIVTNPAPGGGVSLPATFVVANPAPAIATLTPASATAGDPPTTVVIDGTGFVASSAVTFGDAPSATTFVSATELRATLTASQLATAGTLPVKVVNPAPGGGTSAASTFTVNNPAPVLTSVSPTSVVAGSGDTTVTAFGASFVAGSTVQADGAALSTTYVSASELRATVPAATLATAGTIAITVASPGPGASTSTSRTLTVTPATTPDAGASCDTTGVDLPLDATGATPAVTLDYAFGPLARFFYDPTDPTEYTCPVAQLSASKATYAAVVVQNTSGAPAFLEANAVCASTDVAFLAVYAGASSVPTSDADRIACSGFVANGSAGGGAYASTTSNGSTYCPGMTKANGGSITLQPCDKAVLLVQQYDATQYTAPSQLAIQLTL